MISNGKKKRQEEREEAKTGAREQRKTKRQMKGGRAKEGTGADIKRQHI